MQNICISVLNREQSYIITEIARHLLLVDLIARATWFHLMSNVAVFSFTAVCFCSNANPV